eukprot:m.242244 g.242244  ORF g.242244 m.242244 type:complete len:519 (-) comp13992_c0_seq1:222-1778(-)
MKQRRAHRHAGRPASKAAADKAGTSDTWGSRAKALLQSVMDSRHVFHSMETEIRAAIAHDLGRLPQVRQLIMDHVPNLHNVQVHVVEKVHALPDRVREQVASLPDVHQFVRDHLEHVPEWRSHIEAHAPAFLQNAHMPDLHVRDFVAGLLKLRELPSMVAAKLHSIPSVSATVARILAAEEEIEHVVRETMAWHPGTPAMEDIYALVKSNLHNLPDLQHLLHEKYTEWRPSLRSFHVLPDWMRDNEHVLTGYRPELVSFRRCFNSLFYVHNETGNIYSHLIGALLFVVLSVYAAGWALCDRPFMDQVTFTGFCICGVLCLLCSAVFHCTYCHSREMCGVVSRLDYAGITLLIFGSVASFVYFLLYCHPYMATAYVLATIYFATRCLVAVFSDTTKAERVKLFVSFAVVGILPALHYYAVYGPRVLFLTADLTSILLLSCPLYLVGSLVYVTKFPECIFPGRFDIWLHSHQLWHLFVVAAACAHFVGVHNMLDHRTQHHCAAEEGHLPLGNSYFFWWWQ